jgi:hypothetical protein
MPTAEQLIAALDLKPLGVEGGYYRETYRSELVLPASAIDSGYGASRAASTAIYYLLTPNTFSAMHRLPGDEIYHFYLGDPVELLLLNPANGEGNRFALGSDIGGGLLPQFVVPGQTWQGSCLMPGGRVALLGTTMAPGFDFADYDGGDRNRLVAEFPAFSERICRLTRQ